jgi:hypothetical protein
LKIEDVKKEFQAIEEQEFNNRTRQVEDLRFGLADDQWPEDLRRLREDDLDGARPCLTINKISAHARQITNDMRQNRASVRILPVDDAADIETAKILQGMVRHIEHTSNAGMAYDVAAETQVLCGIGYIRVNLEVVDELYNYQNLVIKPVRNPFGVYFDPWVEDNAGADATRVFITDHMSENQFMRMYPDAEKVSWDMAGQGDGWVDKDRIRIAEHWWIQEVQKDYVFVQPRVMPGMIAPPPEPVLAEEIYGYEDTLLVVGERKVTEKELRYQKIAGDIFLEGGEDGDLLPGRYIPVVRVPREDFYIEEERYTLGIVHRAKDAQRAYNYAMSTNIETAALQPKAPWLVGVEAISGHEDLYAMANQKNLPYLPYNEYDEQARQLQPPMRQPPPQPNAQMHALMENANNDLQSVIGQYNASLGETSNERSGLAIHNRQKAGDMSNFHFVDNMAQAVRHVGRIIVDLIPHVYDTERVARILGEDGAAQQIKLSPGGAGETQDENGEKQTIYDVGVGKYDVAVSTGPSFNTKREEAFESMSAIVDGNPQLWNVIGDLMVKNMDWPGAEEMAERLNKMIPAELKGEDDPMAAAQQQIAEMEQQLAEQTQTVGALMAEREGMMNQIASKQADKEINRDKLMAAMIDKDQDRKIKAADIQQDNKVNAQNPETKLLDVTLKHALAEQRLEFEAQLAQMNADLDIVKSALSNARAVPGEDSRP